MKILASNGQPFRGAGCVLYAPSGHCLWLLRNEKPMSWCGAGGGIEEGEAAKDAAARELEEEIGYRPALEDMRPFTVYRDDKLHFYNYTAPVEKMFIPKLNHEHLAHCWTHPDHIPEPRHFGMPHLLDNGLVQHIADRLGVNAVHIERSSVIQLGSNNGRRGPR